ncbi:MAG: nickel-dependent hydrogenase large subunit [Anaerolineaceae bacterium]|nr:nickel-dependent hydrogenase large subunit [Anaerolineaceae bacterium]
MSKIIVPIGPQHPLLKEPLSFLVSLEGEKVTGSILRLGYVHRGIEKLAEQRTYIQNVYLIERICGICSHIHSTTYCQSVEALLKLEVPKRGLYIRMLLCELERIHSHLLWLGILAKNIGLNTLFMYAWRDREIVLDIMEEISGGRVSHAVNIIGGVRVDLNEKHLFLLQEGLQELNMRVEEILRLIENDRSFRARTRKIGCLSLEDTKRFCVVGPVARASGLDIDIRRDAPYAAYDELNFEVPLMTEGDVWARSLLRILETIQAIRLCIQIIRNLPGGPVSVSAPRRVPAGEVISRAEAPRGEVFYYLRSNGSQKPARLKIRTPTLTTLITLPGQLKKMQLADVSAVIAGVDLCIACGDR